MMKRMFKFLLFVLIPVSVFAQTPEKVSYQAVVRDNSETLVKDSNVNLKINVRQGSPKGPSVYEETHYTKTNKNGLVSLEIGTGTIEKGLFSKIDWSKGPFFIETRMDIGDNSSYTITGTSQLLSVPYALHAKSADSFTGKISPDQLSGYYTSNEVDAILDNMATEGGVSQSLKLDKNTLSISGGNSVSLKNLQNNANNDFDGKYSSLTGVPKPFSGNYKDLSNRPDMYTKDEVDKLFANVESGGGVSQSLKLDKNTLSISGGNSVSLKNLQNKANDDFSGKYKDLKNKPKLYTKKEVDDLIDGIETTGGKPQRLSLKKNTLSISGGNSISLKNLQNKANNDFDGKYASLTGAPKVYTQQEVDNIKAKILKDVKKNYTKKAKIIRFTSSRNINNNDVGNTIACIYSTTLTINPGFSAMKVGDIINIEVHGTTLTISGTSGVMINGKSGGYKGIGNDKVYTGGIIRKTGNNSYIVL